MMSHIPHDFNQYANRDLASRAAKTAVWLAEGQSSQRDMLQSLQALKPRYDLTILASHRHDRPEILTCADIAYREPDGRHLVSERALFVLKHARAHGVQVLLTGRNSRDYEARRDAFAAAGIRLLTGATDVATLQTLDDKFAFAQVCAVHDIPVAAGWRFSNVAELEALLAQHGHLALCVKPVSGIFAQGFWRLDTGQADYDSFAHLYDTDARKIHVGEFVRAYTNSARLQREPLAMLLMPYLTGREYSIDVVCERGTVLAAVTRHKQGAVQHVGYDAEVMALVKRVIGAFGCDGIVSVQTRADSNGQQHVLEINSRPSGGIGYTVHSGVDLTQLAMLYFAGLIPRPVLSDVAAHIVPCAVRPFLTSVQI